MQGATNLLNPADSCRSKASSQLYSQLEAVRAELEERGILPPGGLKNVTDKTWGPNYGPFWDPYCNAARNIEGTKKGP